MLEVALTEEADSYVRQALSHIISWGGTPADSLPTMQSGYTSYFLVRPPRFSAVDPQTSFLDRGNLISFSVGAVAGAQSFAYTHRW